LGPKVVAAGDFSDSPGIGLTGTLIGDIITEVACAIGKDSAGFISAGPDFELLSISLV
jgi:hypothetical protein